MADLVPHSDGELARLRRLRMAKDVMDRKWAEPLDLEAVAAGAGYSRYHFVRLFKRAYGETPGRYLSRRRVERAQDLLRSADLTVSEICLAVGFDSLGSFCTRFKQITGSTPTEYRRAVPAGGAPPVPACFALFWAGGFPVGQGVRPGGSSPENTAISEKPAGPLAS
ncbi:helix-turn-helix transcriptional regulator [Actinomadura scrupuli]|uniref:helix-turn-helix transcriptional regulator n=1 Tax=Actinomadura scrupuli TaxID=559629 RepID=UPI003D9804CA